MTLKKDVLNKFQRYRTRHPERVNAVVRKNRAGRWGAISNARRLRENVKVNAWKNIYNRIRRGKLKRPKVCSRCGRDCKPQAHHKNHAKQFEVLWLCRECHLFEHGMIIRVFKSGDAIGPWKKKKRWP